MVIINNKDMKLEETTVTRQSINPRIPTIIVPAAAQQTKGIATQRSFLNINPSATMINSTTAILKVRRSA